MSARQKAAVHAAHLSRKLQHSVTAMRSGEGLPPDLLTPAAVDTRFIGAAGFPDLADSVAYDPSQGLLAVGTSDGRVVLLGRPGVEATLRSPSRSPTQHLCFLPGKGALLRVTQDGDIQLFSATARRLLTSTWLQGDAIRSVALLGAGAQAGAGAPDAPYILLGCESGNVRVVALLDGQGQPAAGARPVADLALQPYQVLGEEVDAKGAVAAVAVAHLRPDRPLLLLVHRNSGALVWDVRAERILCMALEYEGEASKPTCACWVGERANCFAVGYDDGAVLLWGVPSQALQDDPFKVIEPPDARPLMSLRVAARGVQAAPVRSLQFLAGKGSSGSGDRGGSNGPEGWNGEDSLLVFGGQSAEDPDMLTLVPLAGAGQGTEVEGAGRQVPWFGAVKGFCLMPVEGAADGRSLMILTEGGQLVIHDLVHWQPQPLTLPAQELPPITVSKLVPTVNAEQQGEPGGSAAVSPRSPSAASAGLPSPSPLDLGPLSPQTCPAGPAAPLPQHVLTLDRVRACSRRLTAAPSGGARQEASVLEHWPFSGGQPAASLAGAGGGRRHPSALYFTGHRDGRVRVWDATTQVPEMLLTIPAAAGQERLRAVTALEVCPFSGIVAVGHAGGDVRLYQFTESPQQVHRMNIDETRIPYENVGPQPGGFQYVLRYSCHSADASALALATKLKLVAVADEAGNLSLLDLLQPSQLFSTRAMEQPVAALAFASHVIPGAKDEPDVERVVLFLAGADSSACMVGLDRGEPIGRAMKPKNASRPLAMALLDSAGCPLPQLHGGLVLHWANNNSSVTARSLAMTKVASIREEAGQASSRSLGRLSMSERPSSLPAPPGGSRRSTGADSRTSWSRAESGTDADTEREGSVEMHALPSDEELDDHLAAAVQAVEGANRGGKSTKFKLPATFKRPGSRNAVEGGDAAADASSPGGSTRGGASFDPVAALGEFYGGSGPPSPDPWAGSGGSGGEAQQQGSAGEAAGGGSLLSDADLIDYPFLIDGDPTPAAHLLLCCADYLRLYPTANIRLGDRSTERKASFEAPLCFAAPFMTVHGPGVVSIDASDALQVHSLPGLEQLCRKQLEDSRVLGFRWTAHPLASQGSGAAGSTVAAGSTCCSLDGQLVLASAANEIARLAVVADCALPAPPASLYNTRLAAAALEAAARRSGAGVGSSPARSGSQAAQQQPAGGQQQEGEGAPATAFGRFFDQAASTVTGLATTAAGTVMQELDRARAVGQGALQRIGIESGGPSRSLATLEALFATPVEPLDDLDYMPEHEEEAAMPPTAAAPAAVAAAGPAGTAEAAPTAAAAAAPGPSGKLNLVNPREAAAKLKNLLPVGRSKSDRAELLEREGTPSSPAAAAAAGARSGAGAGAGAGSGAAAAASRGKAFTRTASEIKRAYGRPGTSKSNDVRGVMEQNRAMLAERGERLAALDERTREMADDAEDFATMARRLEQQMANRKWWQL